METRLISPQKTSQTSRLKSRLTIGYTYYNDTEQLEHLLEVWKDWPSLVDIFLVDDGSQIFPAQDILHNWNKPDYGPSFQLWRVPRDIGFNSHGCRNLIAKYASTDAIAFLDIDMEVSTETIGRLMTKIYHPRSFYQHDCWIKNKQELLPYPGHLNSFVINKDLFWEAGGYDESFTGHHFGDREFIERVTELPGVSQRHSGNVICLNRIGRHGVLDRDIERTTYVDDDIFYVPLPPDEVELLKGTVKRRLNFPFIKLL
jgi:hypothetical protein